MTGTRAMGGGATAHSQPRERDDFYRTPPSVTAALLKVESFPARVWEPACGDGAISGVLIAAGYDVVSTDLVNRGYGDSGSRDFLDEPFLLAPAIITNPPFKLAQEFTLHALALGAEKIAIFMRLAWLEGDRRHRKLWVKHPPARVWVFSKRQTLWRGDADQPQTTGGTISFAWFIFERGHTGKPRLGWIV